VKGKLYAIAIILMILFLTSANMANVRSSPALTLTIQTDKAKYNLEEKVTLSGSLNLDGSPVTDALVGIQINDEAGNSITYRTSTTGNPPTAQRIEIVEVLPCDDLGNPQFRFPAGSYFNFRITVRNTIQAETHVVLALTCYYEPYNIPFTATVFFNDTIATQDMRIVSFPISTDAIIGAARIYCSAYDKTPESTGVPYCPEASADFMITESVASTGILEQPATPPSGTYRLPFEIPEDAALGNYTAYAVTSYSQQFRFAYTQFEVVQLPRIRVVPRLSIMQPAETVQLNMSIADVFNLTSWEMKVYYNSTILNATQIVEGPFLSTIGATTFQIYQFTDNYNSTHGRIWANCSLNAKTSGKNGAGTLATIAFKAKASKGNTLVYLSDTRLADNSTPPAYIQHTTVNGLVYIGVHDITITDVHPYNIIVGEKSKLPIYVTVKNNGHYAETFNVSIYINTTLVQTKNLISLQTGQSTPSDFNLTWDTTGFAIYNDYTISANVTQVPQETDTADNTFADGAITLVIRGDINSDQIVDIFDAVLLVGAAGSQPGHPKWNSACDLNHDTVIDLFDAVLLAANAGKHYP
jgi:hypothetical protein